jgi:hypothetical protein
MVSRATTREQENRAITATDDSSRAPATMVDGPPAPKRRAAVDDNRWVRSR